MKSSYALYTTLFTIALFNSVPLSQRLCADENEAPKQSEVDQVLAKRFPLPKVTALDEFADDYSKLPAKFLPKEVRVNGALEYKLKGGGLFGAKKRLQAGHLAKVSKVSATEITLSPANYLTFEGSIAIEDTDFKPRIEKIYDKLMENARQKVLEKREKMRAKVESEIRQNQAKKSSFEPKKYGRGFYGDYAPRLRNGLGQKVDHEVPLGPIAGKALALFNAKEATITELWPRGPGAKAGLQVGDRVIKVNGEAFKKYPPDKGDSLEGFPKDMGMAIIEAQSSGRPLSLTIEREGDEQEILIPLPSLPAFSDTYPVDCPRSSFLINSAAKWLEDHHKDNGTWHFQEYTTAWSALSLLATGDQKYANELKITAHMLAERYAIKGEPSHKELIKRVGVALDNWRHCMSGIFLAEYYLATGDKKVLSAIKGCSRRMEARLQPETGRLGHQDTELPYGGFGLVIINVQAHILWALNAQIEGTSWNWEPWDLSYKAVTAAMGKPSIIGYSKASPGVSQSGTRTGAMATALVLAGREPSTQREMGDWLSQTHRRLHDTHAMTSIGLVYGFMGIKNTKPKKLAACYKSFQWKYALMTPPHAKHGMFYFGQKLNHNGDKYLNYQIVANWMTIMTLSAHRSDTLWILGNRSRNWYK